MKDRIKELRKALGWTQQEFADQLGLSKNYISLIENGQRSLGDQSIKLLCSNHNVNEEWIREGTGEMFRKVSGREELASWVAEINRLPTTSAQRRIAKMLTMLNPDDWITIDKMIGILKEDQ